MEFLYHVVFLIAVLLNPVLRDPQMLHVSALSQLPTCTVWGSLRTGLRNTVLEKQII